jgi:hypothetical protein
MAWFCNQYECEECGCSWEDEWSCGCDDDCPECGARHMEPVDSVDLSHVIEEWNGKFLIYGSPDSAEDSPDYELIAESATREAAEEFLDHYVADDPECGSDQVGFVD